MSNLLVVTLSWPETEGTIEERGPETFGPFSSEEERDVWVTLLQGNDDFGGVHFHLHHVAPPFAVPAPALGPCDVKDCDRDAVTALTIPGRFVAFCAEHRRDFGRVWKSDDHEAYRAWKDAHLPPINSTL